MSTVCEKMELSSLVRLGGSSFRCSYCTLFHAFSTHSSHYHPCQNHFKMSSSVYQNIYFPAEGIGSSYPENLRFLYGINDKLKKDGILAPSDSSLTNTLRLYDLIGRPLDRIPTVHVGGTNGKGSTSLKIAESLHACGLRTGLFVSPHLASFRERMQIDGKLMPEDAFMLHLPTVLQLCGNHGIPATLFELTFILACLYYEHTNCQVVVLEVGLGGELDATNVVQTALSIICSVSLDHTRILGATVEEIGFKKAGIFKQNVPALMGPGCPMDIMHSVASSRGALLTTLEEATVKYGRWSASEQGLGHGENGDNNIVAATTAAAAAVDDDYEDTDVLNSRIAHAALSILRETQVALGNDIIFAAIDVWSTQVHHALSTRPPCRWEIHNVLVDATPTHSTSGSISGESMGGSMMGERVQVPVTVVLDVGHNPAAVAALSRRIRKQFTGHHVHMLYAMSRDKDVRTCLKQVLGVVKPDHIHFAQSSNFRAVSKDELSRIFHEETGQEYNHHIVAENVRALVAQVIRLAAESSASSLASPSLPLAPPLVTPPPALALSSSTTTVVVAENSPKSVVIICGTGYIMPDARAQLGIKEPRDDDDLKRIDG